jgi:hypothetical protein
LLKENHLKMSEFLRNKYENPLKMSEFLKNKYFFNEKSPSYVLIPEKDDFLGNSQSNTPNLQFQQNNMKINLEFNEIYWSMKTFFSIRQSLNFYLVRQNAF